MNQSTWANWRKWGNFGLAPIPTRQLGSALFVICGHIFIALAFMLGLVQAQPERIGARPVKTMQFRLKPPPLIVPVPGQTPTQWVAPAAPTAAPAAPTAAAAAAAAAAAPAEGPTLVLAPKAASQPNPNPDPISESATSSTSAPDAAAPAVINEDVPYYYPVRQLHQKPQVIEDIDTHFTLILPGIETQNVILRLFISERGSIDHIDIEQTSLAPEVATVVSAAFSKLRFLAGKMDGMAVKSQIKIEVLLENQQGEKFNGTQNQAIQIN